METVETIKKILYYQFLLDDTATVRIHEKSGHLLILDNATLILRGKVRHLQLTSLGLKVVGVRLMPEHFKNFTQSEIDHVKKQGTIFLDTFI